MARTKTEIALDILPHLAAAAKERRKLTYQDLSALVGHPAWYLGGILDEVRDNFLLRHNLPRLDALIVNKETGEVGDSFYEGGRKGLSDEDIHELLEEERKRVFEFEGWDKIVLNLQRHYGGEQYVLSRGLTKLSS